MADVEKTAQPEPETEADIGDVLVYFGGEVKALGDGRVGGHLVLFGDAASADLEGDYFTRDTDYDLETGDTKTVYYNHGYDPVLRHRKIGRGKIGLDDAGVWIEAQLEMRDQYERAIYELAEAGKLGWSSGTAGHLMAREIDGKAARITRWPIVEASLTPTPADWRNVAAPLKALATPPLKSLMAEPEAGTPEAQRPEAPAMGAARGAAEATGADIKTSTAAEIAAGNTADAAKAAPTLEVMDMTDNKAPEEQAQPTTDPIKALEQQMSDLLNRVTQFMEDSPPIRNSGYYTQDGGAADPQAKSLGDFMLAIKRHDAKRLHSIYGATKDLTGNTGSEGGYLVPEMFHTEMMQVLAATSPIVAGVRRIRVGSDAGRFPSLDQSVTPTAGVGETALAGGAKATGRKQGAAYTETQPQFAALEYRVRNIGGYTQVANELIADSPMSIEGILRSIFEMTLTAKLEYGILNGSGSGSDLLGILKSDCAVSVTVDTNSTFAYADSVEMIAHYKGVSGRPPVWIIHPSIYNDIGAFEIGSKGAGVPSGAGTGGQYLTMPGTPWSIVISEHAPQADNAGCVILADLGAYLLLERQPLAVAFSEHAGFTSGLGTWRFDYRADGMPWLKSKITLADPQGSYYVSPFVYLDD